MPGSPAWSPARQVQLTDELIDRCVGIADLYRDSTRRSRPQQEWVRHATRARQFLEVKPYEALSVKDLCQHVGVSKRTLFYAFKRYFGVTPIHYHHLHRLQKAHGELKRGSPISDTVTHVATNWGFSHLGRFAQHYKRQFGESPSTTLERRPRAPAQDSAFGSSSDGMGQSRQR